MPMRLRPAAKYDLAEIYRYTLKRYGETQADLYVTMIAESCEAVLHNPRLSRDASRYGEGLRVHRSGRHSIYSIRHADKLDVVRVLHGRMNVEDHL